MGNTYAVPKIGYPSLCLQDGPLGVRYAGNVSALPAGAQAASTWDRELIYQRGLALGREAKGLGVHVQLGPVAGPLGKVCVAFSFSLLVVFLFFLFFPLILVLRGGTWGESQWHTSGSGEKGFFQRTGILTRLIVPGGR